MTYERFKQCAEFYLAYEHLPNEDMIAMRDRCRFIRALKNKSQNEMADEIGVSRMTYNQFESRCIFTRKILMYFINDESMKAVIMV